MKRIITFFTVSLFVVALWAQAPNKISYQAVVRNASDQLVKNAGVRMRISILKGSAAGSAVYAETHTPTSNANGVVSFEIGGGTVTSGSFAAIDWKSGPYFIKTETDPAGGTNYTISGTSELQSVPYALHAKTAETVIEKDPLYAASVAAGIVAADTANWASAYRWGDHAEQGYLKTESVGEANDLLTFDGTNWVSKKLSLTINPTGGSQPFSIMQPYLVLNYCIATEGIFPSRNGAEPFIGEIQLYGFNFAPKGFATCNGQIMSIAQNMALFALIGTYYGGNGQTIFALPNLSGRVPVHQGQGPGLRDRVIGEVGGSEVTTLLIANMPAHIHTHTVVYE